MRKNILIVLSIIMLFIGVFSIGNRHYFSTNNPNIVEEGLVTLNSVQLSDSVKLEGEWSFFPNILISPGESLDAYQNKRVLIEVPSNWHEFVQANKDGIAVGTYHIKVRVPVEGQYGLYIRTIRQSNRIFINGIEVGKKGNPSTALSEYRTENNDKYVVMAESKEKEIDIMVHVANFHYPQAGITYPVEIGTMEIIQRQYQMKILADAFVSIGYIIFGVIFIISYGQNRKRKEELFFGLFTISLGLYMSFINQKIFFMLVPITLTANQIRLQLGILPIALTCLTLFIYYMYPKLMKKSFLYIIIILMGIVFVLYGIYNPFTLNIMASSEESILNRKLAYIDSTSCFI